MIKKASFPILFLLFLLSAGACTTQNQVIQTIAQPTETWKDDYAGERIIVVTQGAAATDLISLLREEIPQAMWTARLEYDSDVSGNYLVINLTGEGSGTAIKPIIRKIFGSTPIDNTLQVQNNRVRLGYFEKDTLADLSDNLDFMLKSYGGLIKNSSIENTRGPWYTDPRISYLETTVSGTGDREIKAVNYTTGEERILARYTLEARHSGSENLWKLEIEDNSGIEWISGLVKIEDRGGENLSGFYGAVDGGIMTYSGETLRTDATLMPQLEEIDLEYSNGLTMIWVNNRSLRYTEPNDYCNATIEQVNDDEYLVTGYDFSGRSFQLFSLVIDRRQNRCFIETYQKIRNLELPLIFNKTDDAPGQERSYSFQNLRTNFIQDLEAPVRWLQSVEIGSSSGKTGYIDLHDSRFFSLLPYCLSDLNIRGTDEILIFSNHRPFGNLEFAPELISIYPYLDILSVKSDLILAEEGETQYFLVLKTSPMIPGTTYQVNITPHASLFSDTYLWEFTAP